MSGRGGAANTIGMLVFVTFLGLYLPLYFVGRRMFPSAEGAEKIDPDTTAPAELVRWLGMND